MNRSQMDEETGRNNIENLKKQYEAVLNEDWETFNSYYEKDLTGMLPMTLANDSAIHMAVYSGRKKPLEDLLVKCPSILEDVDNMKNNYGNTPLHVAATTGNIKAVRLLVAKNSNLLTIANNVGETPLFRAAAFGCTDIVKVLAASQPEQIREKKLLRIHSCRRDKQGRTGTSILHIAVEGEHFDTALLLLNLDKSLTQELDNRNGMTCLQLLAQMPSAFKSGNRTRMGLWKSIVYWCLPNNADCDDNDEVSNEDSPDRSICGLPKIKRILDEKRKHEFALKLAKRLIKEDMSWKNKHTITDDSSLSFSSFGVEEQNDEKAKGQGESQLPTSAQEQGESKSKKKKETETPLLLATRHGILEIVDEILKQHPQAVDHCSHMGQNILLLAVKYRQEEIFNLVKQMKIPKTMLVRGIDTNGYTLLHHAAVAEAKGTRSGPALQLQAELKWFSRARKCIPSHYARHVDKKEEKTAEQLFEEKHKDQLKEAQKWIKETSQSCSAVAVLIATVVFAAAYTLPGGSNEKGIPVFLHSPFFLFFTIMDVVSLGSSLTSVVMFLSILSSPFELEDFEHSLPQKLTLGFTLLFISVATTMLAFAATLVLIIQLNHKQWTTTVIYASAFFPVTVFALMQFPLYAAFMHTLTGSFNKVRKFVYRLFCKKKNHRHMV